MTQDRVLGHQNLEPCTAGATPAALGLAASAGTPAGRALGTVRRVRRVARTPEA